MKFKRYFWWRRSQVQTFSSLSFFSFSDISSVDLLAWSVSSLHFDTWASWLFRAAICDKEKLYCQLRTKLIVSTIELVEIFCLVKICYFEERPSFKNELAQTNVQKIKRNKHTWKHKQARAQHSFSLTFSAISFSSSATLDSLSCGLILHSTHVIQWQWEARTSFSWRRFSVSGGKELVGCVTS